MVSSLSAGPVLHEGKSKRVHAAVDAAGTVDPSYVVLYHKDDATAFDGAKHSVFQSKGAINCAMNLHLTTLLEGTGIRTHLVRRLSDVELLCRQVEIVPVEVVVRNIVAGSCCRRFGREEGEILSEPMVEFFLKDDALHDPPISDVHCLLFGWAEQWELEFFRAAAIQVNATLSHFWSEIGMDLVDFKIEFGRTPDGALLLADEISPDGCRLWEKGTRRKFDKDVFRRDLGDLSETYKELYRRVFGAELGA